MMAREQKHMDPRADYWREAMEYAFDGADLWRVIEGLSSEQRYEIGASLATSAEHQSLAFYTPDSPLIDENKRLSRKLKWERELEGCGECGGRGRLEYSAGPWVMNTGCHVCNGVGKVHPRGERQPA